MVLKGEDIVRLYRGLSLALAVWKETGIGKKEVQECQQLFDKIEKAIDENLNRQGGPDCDACDN